MLQQLERTTTSKLWLVLIMLMIFSLPQVFASENASKYVGVWISDNGNEKFEIYEKDGEFFGKIVWMIHGEDLKDVNNPDPELKDRPILGLDILYGFKQKGNGSFSHGKVYDPGSGNTYKCKIKVNGDTAKVRGYILMPLLGRTETAHRVE